MSFANASPELNEFFSTYLADRDPSEDAAACQAFAKAAPDGRLSRALQQLRALREQPELPLEEIGIASNRWFAEPAEAREWLGQLESALAPGEGSGAARSGGDVIVKDSNGAVLSEGDSVLVIRDLKVKGGSSDLKRGTLIRKIHLVGDPEAIECRVDGSTLVLKTCFLKKA